MAVVELRRGHGPAVGRGVVQNRPANVGDAARQRRDVALYRGVGLGNRGDHAVAQQIDQADQKVAGAHGRVADLQVEQRFRGVGRGQGAQVAVRVIGGNRCTKRVQLSLRQRADGFVQDEADQGVRRVVAAGALAREDVGAHDDAAVFAHGLVFQQAFVDGAELLHGQAAIVDVAALGLGRGAGRPLERQGVDHVRHDAVGQPHARQQRGAGFVEQAAVVERQAEGGVAPVDHAAQVGQRVPIPRRGVGERLAPVLAASDVLAHPAAQADLGVARVVHGQQAAVLGIEDEQQPVQQHERGVAHLGQGRVWRRGGDCTGQVGEDLLEHQLRQVGGDALLEIARPLYGALMQRAPVRGVRQKGGTPEEHGEELARATAVGFGEGERRIVGAGQAEHRGQVDLEELFGDRARALMIQSPLRAVGQHAPAQPAVGEVVGAAQIAQHLRGWGQGFPAAPGGAVERAAPAFRLYQRRADGVPRRPFGQSDGAGLGRGVREQQAVRHIGTARGTQLLLAQAGVPAEMEQDGPDQVVFGLALIGRAAGREPGQDVARRGREIVQRRGVERLPLRQFVDRRGEKIFGEQTPAHRGIDRHGRQKRERPTG